MKGIVFTTLTAFFLTLNYAVAQDEYVLIEKSKIPRKEKKPIRFNDNTSEIKFSPTQILAGEINFSYEKKISPNSSFEIGAGPTLSNITLGSNRDYYYYYDPYYGGGYAYQTSGVGLFVELGYRFYPLDKTEALNRLYFSPILKYRIKNYGLSDASNILEDRQGKEEVASFAFNTGYQLWMSDRFSMDFFTGLGVGYQMDKDYRIGSYYDVNTQSYVNQWENNSGSFARYVINFGFKVGIGYK